MFFSSVVAAFIGMSAASAQTYGTDYLTFKGWGVILDDPIPSACATAGNFRTNSRFKIVYRFSANPSVIADALTFTSEAESIYRIVSTQSQTDFSLDGISSTDYQIIDRMGNFSSGSSGSWLQISAGSNQLVSLTTGNIKLTNSFITKFFGIATCDLTNFHGAAVAVPQ
jgi:hypothetical protein